MPRPHGLSDWLAAVVGTLAGLMALASVVLAIVNLGTPSPPFTIYRELFATDLLVSLVHLALGTLLVVRGRHPVGWALITVGVGFGTTSFAMQYAILGVDHPGLPAYAAISQLVACGWAGGVLTGILVLPWVVSRETPTGAYLSAAIAGSLVTLNSVVWRYLMEIPGGEPVLGDDLSDLAWTLTTEVFVPLNLVLGLGGAVALAVRARRTPPDERLGMHWVALSVLLMALCYFAFEVGLGYEPAFALVAAAPLTAAMVMLPAAVFALAARQPSRSVGLVVSRTVVGALLTIAVVTAYLALVWLGGRYLSWSGETVAPLGVAALALGAMPLRVWLQRQVDRLVFGTGTDAGRLLDRLGSEIERRHGEVPILQGLLDGLRHTLRLRTVCVEADDDTLRVSSGADPVLNPTAIALRSRGVVIGRLVLDPPVGERLDVRTLHLVEQLAALVAVALDLALVNADLDQARSRLVDVRQEERRLLRRELHDSLGPSLAGTSLALSAVTRNVDLEPKYAELLAQVEQELVQRAEDVRGMARVLLPPALEEGHLDEALRTLARRFATPRFTVTVATEGADALASGQQVAIYHIAAEGVLNAFRHADARTCTVSLDRTPEGAVRLVVADDGVGMPEDADAGIGLRSMRERAAELGGTVTVDGSGSGTTVTVVLT